MRTPAPRFYDAVLDRVFAGLYDAVMASAEAAVLGPWRTELLGQLSGEVLEVGAGTGACVPHYPRDTRLTLLEPDAHMRARLEAKLDREAKVVAGIAEDLPFDDGAFDAVVAGLVLCSVHDLDRAVGEMHRVLRPGGRLVFIEHVGASDPGWRRWQHRLEPVWKVCARGCCLTRDTEQALAAAGFDFERLEHTCLPGPASGLTPAIRGIAIR